MRDPNRIDDLLKRLADAWRKCPDMRLGQLMIAVTGDIAPTLGNVEDEELIRAIETLVAGNR